MFASPRALEPLSPLLRVGAFVLLAALLLTAQTLDLSTDQLVFQFEVGQPAPPPQTFDVMSTPSGESFSARVDVTIISADWLSLVPTNGTTPGTVTVTVDSSRFLSPGSRQADVLVRIPAHNLTKLLKVTAQVSPPSSDPTIAASPAALTFIGSSLGNPIPPQLLEISNPGGGVLTYTIVTTYPIGAPTGWLTIDPTSDTVSFQSNTHQVFVDPTGLLAGKFQASLVITGNAANSPLVIPVTLDLGDSARIVASPTSLMFSAPEGGINPAGQPFAVINGGGGILPYLISSDQPWLALRPVNGDATLGPVEHEARVNIQNIPQGTYLGNLTIAAGSASNSPLLIPVTLKIGPPSSVFALPTRLDFVATAGTPLREKRLISIVNSPLLPGIWLAEVVQSDAPWLKISSQSGTIPGELLVDVDTSGLGADILDADIKLTSINTQALNEKDARKQQTPAELTIPVRLAILNQGPVLGASPSALLFKMVDGGPTLADQILNVENFGGPLLNWTATIETENGTSWLGLRRDSGTAPSPNVVTVNSAGLTSGVHRAAIKISAGAQVLTVPVSLVISESGALIEADRSGIYLETVPNAEIPSTNIRISNRGTAGASWSLQTTGFSDGSIFLAPTPRFGTSSGPASASSVSVQANSAGFATGLHGGLIEVRSTSDDSPRYVSAMLNVLPQTRPPARTVSPGGLLFVAPAASPAPPPQTLRIWRNEPGATDFQATANTFDDSDWLTVTPATGSTNSGGRVDLQVSVNASSVNTGLARGLVSISFGDGNVYSANITLVVPEGGVFGCTSSRIVVAPIEPSLNYQATGTRALHLAARLVDSCGDALNDGAVLATFSNSDPALALQSRGNGIYSATWSPRNPAGQVSIIYDGQSGIFHDEAITIGSIAAGNEPRISPGGFVNGASFGAGQPLSPGVISSGFGINLATESTAATDVPLPTALGTSAVVTAGADAPLYFSSVGQVNLQFPTEAAAGTTAEILVRNQGLYSVPEEVAVASAGPGQFVDLQGRVIAQNENASLNRPENAARRGEAMVFYLTGIGEVSPPVVSGAGAPAAEPLARATLAVEISIGGVPVQPFFVGMTPGFVGLAQANAILPQSVPIGAAVAVTITIDGQSSNSGTVSIAE